MFLEILSFISQGLLVDLIEYTVLVVTAVFDIWRWSKLFFGAHEIMPVPANSAPAVSFNDVGGRWIFECFNDFAFCSPRSSILDSDSIPC